MSEWVTGSHPPTCSEKRWHLWSEASLQPWISCATSDSAPKSVLAFLYLAKCHQQVTAEMKSVTSFRKSQSNVCVRVCANMCVCSSYRSFLWKVLYYLFESISFTCLFIPWMIFVNYMCLLQIQKKKQQKPTHAKEKQTYMRYMSTYLEFKALFSLYLYWSCWKAKLFSD